MKKIAKRLVEITLTILLVLMISGCIRSRVIITSDPPEADLTFNSKYRGRTPVVIPITWYWFYDVELEKEGFEKITRKERFRAPVWFWMPLDLLMEAMPFPIYDTKYRHYVMVPSEEL